MLKENISMMDILKNKINQRFSRLRNNLSSFENDNEEKKNISKENNNMKESSNILKEIKVSFITKGEETPVKDLDLFISQKKIFNILFYSSNLSISKESIKKYKNIIQNYTEEIKTIICLCDETEEDFNISLIDFSDINCFIIPFDSKMNDLLINYFKIISVPRLIVLNNDGITIDTLNNTQIINLTEEIFNGWINVSKIIPIIRSNTPEIGDKLWVTNHSHELIFADYRQKSSGYAGGWRCDVCDTSFNAEVPNFHCGQCSFDICEKCLPKYKKD